METGAAAGLWALVTEPVFWKSLFEIIVVNVILSGDNAVVIALAARNLPKRQQMAAVFWGSAAAIVLRVVLTLFALQLLQYPYLKMAGAILLIWIGAKLLLPEDEQGADGMKGSSTLFSAIQTILIADLVMSLDNVIAVAAAAETGPAAGRTLLLILGLGLSIPLIIVGSRLLLRLMARWPVIITLGAALLGFVAGGALLGWIGGGLVVNDTWLAPLLPAERWFHFAASAAGAALVVFAARLIARRTLGSPA